jgi:hypothetical protein
MTQLNEGTCPPERFLMRHDIASLTETGGHYRGVLNTSALQFYAEFLM